MTSLHVYSERSDIKKFREQRKAKKLIRARSINMIRPTLWPPSWEIPPWMKALSRGCVAARCGSPCTRRTLCTASPRWSTNSIFCGTLISCTCTCGLESTQAPRRIGQGGGSLPSSWPSESRSRFRPCCGSRSTRRPLYTASHWRSISSRVWDTQFWNTCSRGVCVVP